MRIREPSQVSTFIAAVGLVFLFTGCVYDPHYRGPPPRHPHYHIDAFDYFYYPGIQVYFHISTGYYFYYVQGRWHRSRTLPVHIHLYPHDRVKLKIRADKPYLRHHEHRQRYQSRPHPKYKADPNSSLKEREANRLRYEEYEHKRGKRKDRKNPKKETR